MRTEEALTGLLLELLDAPAVQDRIREILASPPDTPETLENRDKAVPGRTAAENRDKAAQGQTAAEQSAELDSLKRELDDRCTELNSLKQELQRLYQEKNQLQADYKQQEWQTKQAENRLSQTQDQYKTEQSQWETERKRYETDRSRWETERRRYEEERARLAARYGEAERRFIAEQARVRSEEAARQAAERKAKVLDSQLQPFRDLLTVYNAYRAVPGTEWKRILPDTNPVLFLSVGCQRDTVIRLWDALRDVCEGDRPQGWETLLDTLRYLCDRYNSTMSAPVWILMEGEQGQPFQDTRHMRSSRCSRYHGTVQRVLLPGLWNNNREQAERKTVVYFE